MKLLWEWIKALTHLFFVFATGLIFFVNFADFVISGGEDALALAWMCFSGLWFHEIAYKHTDR